MSEFYVYVHFRADDGIPFYVGKGKGRRAWSRRGRNPRWTNVETKHGRKVVLWYTGLEETEAFEEEIRLIALFTSLYPEQIVNLCVGGEGMAKPEKTLAAKQRIRDFYAEHGRFPSQKRAQERALRNSLSYYTNPNSIGYDAAFSVWCESCGLRGPRKEVQQEIARIKSEILEFMRENGRPPSLTKEAERRLSIAAANYSNPRRKSYDASFAQEIHNLGYGSTLKRRSGEKKQRLMEFARREGRKPDRVREKAMFCWMQSYLSPSSLSHDPEFRTAFLNIIQETADHGRSDL